MNWLRSLRLQLPSDITKLGSIGGVSYSDNSVNTYSMQNEEKNTQKVIENSKNISEVDYSDSFIKAIKQIESSKNIEIKTAEMPNGIKGIADKETGTVYINKNLSEKDAIITIALHEMTSVSRIHYCDNMTEFCSTCLPVKAQNSPCYYTCSFLCLVSF